MPLNDKNFIKRLKRGDETALEYTVDRFLPAVKGAVYKVLSEGREREECIQDVFLAVWYHRDSFVGETAEDFKRWIYKIAKYKAIDYYRRHSRDRAVSMDILPETADGGAFEEFESRESFMELIEMLPDDDKKIFIMKYALGMRSEDIAKSMGMTRTAVDNRIYRGKKRIDMRLRGLEEVSV